jgi:hypothetical protein
VPAAGGWNQRIPPGIVRCACRSRQLLWARLSARAGAPCCTRLCCQAPRAAIVTDRASILALRTQCLRERWVCPRCGQPVSLHQRNFECLDAPTRAIREVRVRYRR